MQNNLIKVSQIEWEDAEAFFKANPHEIKFRKAKKLARAHSFFNFDGVIYVVNNTKHSDCEPDAGKGGFARVKRAFNQEGDCFAIRIEAHHDEEPTRSEQILHALGQQLSSRKKRVVNKKAGESGTLILGQKGQRICLVEKKSYTLMKYLGNRDLFDELITLPESKGAPLSQDEKLMLMLKAMMSAQYLHQKNIAHLDIKPENFVVNGHGVERVVTLVDFDFSEQMPSNEDSANNFKMIPGEIFGTKSYLSPEIKLERVYSLESDIYAFGYILWGLNVNHDFYKNLILTDRTQRPSLIDAMLKIALHLDRVKNKLENFLLKDEIESTIQNFWPLVPPETLPPRLSAYTTLQTYLPYEEIAALRIYVSEKNAEQPNKPLPFVPLLCIRTEVERSADHLSPSDAKCIPCKMM